MITFLSKAPDTVAAFQRQIKLGLIDPSDAKAVESALFALLLAESDVGEITLTHGEQTGFNEDGAIQLAATPRWQLSVVRSMDEKDGEYLWSRHVYQENATFVADRRILERNSTLGAPSISPESGTLVSDPTLHLTFTTPASRDFYGQLLWSDLHWSQLGANQPQDRRDIEVSVQQTVADASDKFAGVIRVGLLRRAARPGGAAQTHAGEEPDPHRIFLSDREGRLDYARCWLRPGRGFGEDLRIAPADLAPEIAQCARRTEAASGRREYAGRIGKFSP